ncbi:MAG: hypothetical protein LRS43_02440, partial [Desulfurococcales archaeon]|nr:hypothetical protein [Desulfurococcales archaeon]
MRYWGLGVPDWAGFARELLSRGSGKEILKYPGLQPVLERMGVKELAVEEVELGTLWDFRGIASIVVNGGGPLSEEPLGLSTRVIAPLRSISPWKGIRELLETLQGFRQPAGRGGLYYLNILGWRPILPITGPDPPSCRRLGDISAGVLDAPPLGFQEASERCQGLGYSKTFSSLTLGDNVELRVSGEGSRGPLFTIIESSGFHLVATRWAALARGEGTITVAYGMLDPEIAVLFPLHYRSLGRLRGELNISGLSVVIRGSRSTISVSSPTGFEARLYRGRAEISFKNTLSLVVGGEVQAYRTLIEQTIEWEPISSHPGSLGHVRSGAASPVVIGADASSMVMAVSNPSSYDSTVEVLLRAPLDSVYIESLIGETT